MTTLRLIGLVGKARSGKDTFASVLVREGEYVRLALADELKSDVARFLGITLTELEARKDEFRVTLQTYGTHRRLRDGSDYWIKRLSPRLTRELRGGASVVVTDVRYRNEAKFIRDQGGIIVRRVRSDGVGLDSRQAQHSSETEMETILVDHTCICGTIPEIQEHARGFIEKPRGDG